MDEAANHPAESSLDSGEKLDGLAEDVICWASRDEVARRFRELAARWRADTAYLSSSTRIHQHPAYLEIIALGKDAVPLILQDLEQEPDHWFAALRAITGENPVASEDRGYLDRMAVAWIRWGAAHGFR